MTKYVFSMLFGFKIVFVIRVIKLVVVMVIGFQMSFIEPAPRHCCASPKIREKRYARVGSDPRQTAAGKVFTEPCKPFEPHRRNTGYSVRPAIQRT